MNVLLNLGSLQTVWRKFSSVFSVPSPSYGNVHLTPISFNAFLTMTTTSSKSRFCPNPSLLMQKHKRCESGRAVQTWTPHGNFPGMSTIRHNSFQSDFFRESEYIRRVQALRPEQPAYLWLQRHLISFGLFSLSIIPRITKSLLLHIHRCNVNISTISCLWWNNSVIFELRAILSVLYAHSLPCPRAQGPPLASHRWPNLRTLTVFAIFCNFHNCAILSTVFCCSRMIYWCTSKFEPERVQ